MKLIKQIFATSATEEDPGSTFCLTEDGVMYERAWDPRQMADAIAAARNRDAANPKPLFSDDQYATFEKAAEEGQAVPWLLKQRTAFFPWKLVWVADNREFVQV